MSLEHELSVKDAVKECMTLIREFESMNLFAPNLLRIETKLSARYTFLQGKKARYQFEQNSAYWVRKLEHSRESIKARKTGEIKNQQLAEHMANVANIKQIEDENYSVWRFEHLKGFCSGIDKVLIAIAHRLRDISTERAMSGNTGHA